ncbi:hypothetical protein O0I10_007958 [Lichtheimia ornata]|uniref:Uncharacterized protein n=1 Tax=Lichtheimia ornata TaxID=688661 RepID=A0AAD7XVW1_9FUNG|nr:uncharacterized protein O0I10_007958 [Lichtheimia ornata]KAJ8656390.1 hypothetical protein O0I10_007958 [Lichtheimia ornata]
MSGYASTTTATLFTSYGWPSDAVSLGSLSPVYSKREEEPVRSLLKALIKNHHDVFHIEHRDKPNELARVLVALHDLGATREKIVQGYYKVIPTLVPLLHTNQKALTITRDSWKDYLGDTQYYRAYLAFFTDQIQDLGIESTIDNFLFDIDSPLSTSFGAQLQPLVHMTFGLEYGMQDIVAQGLAYLASSHTDIQLLIQEYDNGHCAHEPEHILFDMVAADPRFDGRMETADTVPAAIKILLKSQASLLATYVNTASLRSPEQLVHLAAKLLPIMQHCRSGASLLASALAIQAWASTGRNVDQLLRIQWLATLCTYIAENRPMPPAHTSSIDITPKASHENNDLCLWQKLIDRVLNAVIW